MSRREVYFPPIVLQLLALSAGVGTLVAWLAADGTAEWMLTFAGSAEFFGVLLVAAPELGPYVERASAAAGRARDAAQERGRRLVATIRRRLGRTQTVITHGIGSAEAIGTGNRVTANVSVLWESTIEDKLRYLLGRDQHVRKQLQEHAEQLAVLPAQWQIDIARAAGELHDEQDQALKRLAEAHLGPRLLGIVLLLAGIVLATWGNLL